MRTAEPANFGILLTTATFLVYVDALGVLLLAFVPDGEAHPDNMITAIATRATEPTRIIPFVFIIHHHPDSHVLQLDES